MNLLITGAVCLDDEKLNIIKRLNHNIVFMQQEKDSLPCNPKWVQGVVCNGLFLSHDIKEFSNLKFIQLTSAGYDRVPMDYIKSHDIEIHNARGVYSIPMAEFAVCGVLQLYKQSRFFLENQKSKKWEKHRGLTELCGKAVCVVGCGSVGSECAKRFNAFGCRVTGIDIKPYKSNDFETMLPLSRLNEVLSESDIVILTLPLCEETFHLINAQRLSKMKQNAILLNIARGSIVDTAALEDALTKNLGGAVLDVFEDEPLKSNSPLWNMENVIITPHNSFVGDKTTERLSNIIIKNIKNLNFEKQVL